AAVAIFAGAGFFRSVFRADGEPDETFSVLVDESALPELSELTPLANPDHALRVESERGTIVLDEKATVDDLLDAGAVISENYGIVGYRQICELFRALRAGEEYELILAKAPLNDLSSDKTGYQSVKLNTDGTIDGKSYLYQTDFLQTFTFRRATTSYSNGFALGYAQASGVCRAADAALSIPLGMALDPSENISSFLNSVGFIAIPSMTDYLDATGFSDEKAVKIYLTVLDHLPDLPGINVLYGDEYTSPDQLPLFLALAEDEDVRYCSTAILSIEPYTKIVGDGETPRYGETFYALEYLDGRYRVFTMKDGFEGEFDEQLFDGYTIEDDTLIFENERVTYRFPYEKTRFVDPKFSYNDYRNALSDVTNTLYSRSSLVLKTDGDYTLPIGGSHGGEDDFSLGICEYDYVGLSFAEKPSFQKFLLDPFYWRVRNLDMTSIFRINKEYSDGERKAIAVDTVTETTYISYILGNDQYGYQIVYQDPKPAFEIVAAAPEASDAKYRLYEGVSLTLYQEDCDLREMPDGRTYLFLSKEEWENLSWYSDRIWKNGDTVSYSLKAVPFIK
ncbi:MAG: hypothetical protein NC202_12370, partial [Roseburia sp.]|nr:hypothetical protein [Roseburia sp.]